MKRFNPATLSTGISMTMSPRLHRKLTHPLRRRHSRFPMGQKRGLRGEVKNDPTDPNYSRPPAKAGLSVFAILSMLLRGHYT